MTETGAVLLLLYGGAWAVVYGAGAVGQWAASDSREPALAEFYRRWAVSWVAYGASALALAVLLARFVPVLCRRWARPEESSGSCRAALPFGAGTVLGAAVAIGLCYLLMQWLGPWRRAWYVGPDWPGAILPWLKQVTISSGLSLAVLWLSGFITWPLGRRLSGSRMPPQDAEASSARLAVEVALAVMALWGLEGVVRSAVLDLVPGPTTPAVGLVARMWPRGLHAFVGCALVLAFKGDLAWLCRPRGMPLQEPLPRVRAALLQPALFLVGLWFALYGGAALVSGATVALFEGQGDPRACATAWLAVAGLFLIVEARRLAGWLSHGRVVPALWRRIAAR